MEEIIKSISYSQNEIIENILKLYCDTDIEIDPTYSTGNFYKNNCIKEPKYKIDINPQGEDVLQGDCRKLSFEDDTFNTIMFDPPFLATSGKSLKAETGNIINKRFGVYPNEKTLHEFYLDSLKEFYRILKYKGILIFKCQDKISSGKQYLSHCYIIEEAIKLGFYCEDIFILLAKNRIVANWQRENQKSARKYHSYFLVFRKINKKIKYIGV